jgi:gamma-glutamylcyclotransferase (GGCT)/AIG2-like uncharacterized protein YtfP
MAPDLVFVYGSLRRDCERPMSVRFPDSIFVADVKVKGSLYDLGEFPGLQLDGSDSLVAGELYQVDGGTLRQLDVFEASTNYRRKQVEISLGGDERKCWTYEPDFKFYSLGRLVASGDWVEYAKAKLDRP